MTTRKPKLDLLYATDCTSRRLQLAVVTPSPSTSQQQARRWQAARNVLSETHVLYSSQVRKH